MIDFPSSNIVSSVPHSHAARSIMRSIFWLDLWLSTQIPQDAHSTLACSGVRDLTRNSAMWTSHRMHTSYSATVREQACYKYIGLYQARTKISYRGERQDVGVARARASKMCSLLRNFEFFFHEKAAFLFISVWWTLNFDEHLTLSDQISALSKSCYSHIRQLRCIRPYLDLKTYHRHLHCSL